MNKLIYLLYKITLLIYSSYHKAFITNEILYFIVFITDENFINI